MIIARQKCLLKINTLKYNHGEKSLKAPFTIYADLENILIKQQSCQNNPNESYTERKAIHEPCGYSLDLVSSFNSKQNKHSFYRGKDCIKKFCGDLKELAAIIINYKEKEMIPLTDNENKFYEEQKVCHICKKQFCYDKDEKKRNLNYITKLETIVVIQESLEELLTAFII